MSGIEEWVNQIHEGDSRERLRDMPASSIHCVVTSPPYFGLRDYDVDGQIGLEESLDEYVSELVSVGSEIKRILRDDGSWWLNLGDSFASKPRGNKNPVESTGLNNNKESFDAQDSGIDTTKTMREKQKMLVPHRVAIALQDSGWIIRADAVWAKPNPMPHPVKDRLNEHKEYLFHLTPKPNYWFDLDAIREPHKESSIGRSESNFNSAGSGGHASPNESGDRESVTMDSDQALHPNGKNPGDLIEVPVRPFPDAHFAVYPPELVETPIKASCPSEVCSECGTPYERVADDIPVWELENSDRPQLKRALELADDAGLSEEHFEAIRSFGFADAGNGKNCQTGTGENDDRVEELALEAKDVLGGYFREFATAYQDTGGFEQSCDCETDETEPGIVIDPFAGAGTTPMVAKRLGRRFVGIELNPEYVAMAQKRAGVTVDEPDRLLEDGETSLTAYTDGGTE